jgi:protein-disulfide isomerase
MDIVEMADFQCPACRMAAQSFKPFLAAHPDKVRLTFRNYPLDDSCNPNMHHPLHLFACKFARGGICAAKQNKFWEYNDQIYGHQSEEMGPSLIDETVKTIGLDAAAFDSCLKDPATGNAIQKDIDYGTLVNLESTPTVIINGHMMVGAHPPSDLEALLDYIETQPKK